MSADDGNGPGLFLSEEDAEQHNSNSGDMTVEDKLNNLAQVSRTLAHQFNNLLTTILANVQLASLVVEDDKVKPYLDAVEEATGEAGEIVRKFQERIHTLVRPDTQRRRTGQTDLLIDE